MRRGHFLGDTQGLVQHPFPDARPETRRGPHIDLTPEQGFEMLLKTDQTEQAGWTVEFDQHIDVAAFPSLIARNRAEQRQRLHTVLSVQVAATRRKDGDDVLAFHIVGPEVGWLLGSVAQDPEGNSGSAYCRAL